MYIDPIKTDTHLLNIQSEVKRLHEVISDMEWNGQDCATLKLQLDRLQDLWASGFCHVPLF